MEGGNSDFRNYLDEKRLVDDVTDNASYILIDYTDARVLYYRFGTLHVVNAVNS